MLLLVLSFGCRSDDARRALVEIEAARARLSSLAGEREGFAKDAVTRARQALLEAERSVREARTSTWQPKVVRALDLVEIAGWVAERQRERRRADAESWLDRADVALDDGELRAYRGLHAPAAARHREAARLLAEAHAWFAQGAFEEASEWARRSLELAGELPEETKRLLARFQDSENLRHWRGWVEAALAEGERSGRAVIVVDKRDRLAMLWKRGRAERLYRVELGFDPFTAKRIAGDGATPEGLYRVTRKKSGSETRYYKALLLSYPNAEDRRRFDGERVAGRIAPGTTIGGLIEIHGGGGRGANWTDGCVAVSNKEMDALFEAVDVGSPVAIVGAYDGLGEGKRTP